MPHQTHEKTTKRVPKSKYNNFTALVCKLGFEVFSEGTSTSHVPEIVTALWSKRILLGAVSNMENYVSIAPAPAHQGSDLPENIPNDKENATCEISLSGCLSFIEKVSNVESTASHFRHFGTI